MKSTNQHLRPVFRGTRFEGGALPLEVLRDISVLQEMIVDVAKSIFLKEHPDRSRSPRGFAKQLEVRLVSIEEGSAVPVLALPKDLGPSLFPDASYEASYVRKAWNAIVDGIDAAARDSAKIIDFLPAETLNYFDRFGRSLKDDELIELTRTDSTTPVRLNRETRRKLVLASPSAKGLSEEVTLRGRIPEADQEQLSFHLMLADGRKIKGPIEQTHRDEILAAFDGWLNGQAVELRGIGILDRAGRLLRIESIQEINLLDPLDVAWRIDHIADLSTSWAGEEGTAPPKAGLDWLAMWLSERLPLPDHLPFLYPTPTGGVQAEWELGSRELSLEIDLEKKTGFWHCLDHESGEEEERDLHLEDDETIRWIADRVKGSAEE